MRQSMTKTCDRCGNSCILGKCHECGVYICNDCANEKGKCKKCADKYNNLVPNAFTTFFNDYFGGTKCK